ncbi:restriction endonuclease subunit S [Streptomyces filamentosus]|uniref:restriction endonuclease subunit S n=1 Tax=Streptomyces filamentosus TaxID=67294 RepID=UPI0036EC6431
MSELTRLGDVVELLTGFPFKSSGFVDRASKSTRLLRGDNIGHGTLRWGGARYWPEDKNTAQDKYALAVDDVVLAMDRPWISSGIKWAAVRSADLPCLLVQRVARLRAKGVLEQSFLPYLVSSRQFSDYVQGVQTGTAVPHISSKQIQEFQFRCPSVPEQRAIAAVLGALDDKISVNERIAGAADQLSAELFRNAILTSPGRFTEQALSETAEFVNGRAFTKDATGTGRMVVRIAEINSGPGSSTVYNAIDVPEKHLARPGDVLFAWSGSLTAARWFRPEAIINQHIFKCVPKNGFPQWLVSQLVHQKIDRFRAIAADKATTMGHIQRKHLDEPVLVPTRETLASLDVQIAPLWERALLAERENLALANLRDTLLPQLMSGRLRVRDAEKIFEDHV